MEPIAAELTGVMGQDADGDELAAEERRWKGDEEGYCCHVRMSNSVITEFGDSSSSTVRTWRFINIFFNSIQLQTGQRSFKSISLGSTGQ